MSVLESLDLQTIVNENSIKHSTGLFDLLVESHDYTGSLRTLQRYVKKNEIKLNSDKRCDELDLKVNQQIRKNGKSYGRRMLRGALAAAGDDFSEREVRDSMLRVAPHDVEHRRSNAHRLINPQKYISPRFGYNYHYDQHEKLTQYGCTLVGVVDGHSNAILGIDVMPFKNNVAIVRDLYLPLLKKYGLPEQILVDCGQEFALLLATQKFLKDHRLFSDGSRSTRPPYRQIKSTQNNRIERLWKEVNERVAYPIRYAMKEIEDSGNPDINNQEHQYVIGVVVRELAAWMIGNFVAAWNNHRIPNAGIPLQKMSPSGCFPVPSTNIPTIDQLVQMFINDGGTLTEEHEWGVDPIDPPNEGRRNADVEIMLATKGGYEQIAEQVLDEKYELLRETLLEYIHINEKYI